MAQTHALMAIDHISWNKYLSSEPISKQDSTEIYFLGIIIIPANMV